MIRNGIKTKADIKRAHDAMARFIIELCRYSDEVYSGFRGPQAEKNYQTAQRLLRRAGFKYETKKP